MILIEPIIILANGAFPHHHIPLKKLKEAQSIICLDGAVNNLIKNNMQPDLIIGDLDSISSDCKGKYHKIIIHDRSQDDNDLRKALYWLDRNEYKETTILGATGKREDHSIGNIFSILDININLNMKIITDYGAFEVVKGEAEIPSYKGQQISFFTSSKDTRLTTLRLKYNFNYTPLNAFYSGTLNESKESSFYIKSENGNTLIYRNHICKK